MSAGNPGAVIPSRYLEALGDADPLVSQREAPARVRALIAGLGEDQLEKRPAPAKWSIKEVIAHLADGEVIGGARLRFIGAHDRPPLPGYDQDAFVERLGVERTTTASLMNAFEMARAVNVELFERLPPEALDRVGLHAERGEESIRHMLRLHAGHDRVHEKQLQEIRRAIEASDAKGATRSGPSRDRGAPAG